MFRTTLTISTDERTYTVQGPVNEIDTLFDRLVSETIKPRENFTEDHSTDLRGHSAVNKPVKIEPYIKEDHPVQLDVGILASEIPDVPTSVPSNIVETHTDAPIEEEPTVEDYTPVEEPTEKEEPKKYKGFLMIKCQHCGEIKGFNAKNEISEYTCNCGGKTPLETLVPMTALCECGKHWRYLTNMSEESFEINCINCGSPIPVFWNDNKNKFETLLETIPRDKKKKKGGRH